MYGGIKTGQVSVLSSAGGTQIVAERVGRGSVTVVNQGTTDVFLGMTGLTITSGVYLVGVAGASITLSTQAEVYGRTGGSVQTVSYVEVY